MINQQIENLTSTLTELENKQKYSPRNNQLYQDPSKKEIGEKTGKYSPVDFIVKELLQ